MTEHTHTRRAADVLHDRFVASLSAPAVWALMLRSAATHSDYGPINIMMITAQRPGASDVRPRAEWERLGHQVLEGEEGIHVFVTARDADGTPRWEREAFPPDARPLTWAGQNWEYATCISHYDVAEVFDISQTTAAKDEEIRNRRRVPPLPTDFIEQRAIGELENEFGIHVRLRREPTEESARARLQELARAMVSACWGSGDPDWDEWPSVPSSSIEAQALSVAHLVSRMAGMLCPGQAPVPTKLVKAMGCNDPIKVTAIEVIRAAQETFSKIVEICPCCGELGDQCTGERER
jgi:hypothetical protein